VGATYSRVVSVQFSCGTPTAVELPMPPRGELTRMIITQTAGDPEEATCHLYNRKGACTLGTDLNVRASGIFTSVDDDGDGNAAVSFDEPHGLLPNDQFVLKSQNSETAYAGTVFTVVTVLSATQVITDVTYTVADSGVWQVLPWLPITAPVTHLVKTFTKESGTDLIETSLQLPYENQDNQSQTMRCRHSALWLDILTVGAAELLTFEIAYTVKSDTVV
jgi:hypothetical protein